MLNSIDCKPFMTKRSANWWIDWVASRKSRRPDLPSDTRAKVSSLVWSAKCSNGWSNRQSPNDKGLPDCWKRDVPNFTADIPWSRTSWPNVEPMRWSNVEQTFNADCGRWKIDWRWAVECLSNICCAAVAIDWPHGCNELRPNRWTVSWPCWLPPNWVRHNCWARLLVGEESAEQQRPTSLNVNRPHRLRPLAAGRRQVTEKRPQVHFRKDRPQPNRPANALQRPAKRRLVICSKVVKNDEIDLDGWIDGLTDQSIDQSIDWFNFKPYDEYLYEALLCCTCVKMYFLSSRYEQTDKQILFLFIYVYVWILHCEVAKKKCCEMLL